MLDRHTPPPVTDFPLISIPRPELLILDNGIRLVIFNSGVDEVNNIHVVWEGGVCESPDVSSMRLFASLVSEATVSRPGDAVANELEYNGSWLTVKVHDHYTALSVFLLNSRIKEVLPVVADIILSPSFPEDAIVVKRQKAVASLKLNMQKVNYRSGQSIRRMVMGGDNPVARTETVDSIESVTRDDLAGLHCSVMRTKPPTIFVSGKIDGTMVGIIVGIFGSMSFSGNDKTLNISPLAPDFSKSRINDYMPDMLQSAISMAIPAIPRSHPDYDMLRIAATALGGYFGSRLMYNIREEKGYTYGISGGLTGMLEGGYLGITCQCANEFVEPVIEETVKEIERLRTELMSDDELANVRRYLQSQLAETLDNPFSICDYYVKQLLYGFPEDYFMRQQYALNEATPESVRDIAYSYMDSEKLLIAVSGSI